MQSNPIRYEKEYAKGLFFAITLLHRIHSINKRTEQSWLWISSTWNWQENWTHLYMDDLKLLGRNENDLKNEIKIYRYFFYL